MNYEGLPFETVWVELPDLKDVCEELGAAPTMTRPDGSKVYTLPVIHDLSTGAVISDSFAIAAYLDTTYPDTPRVIPDGTRGLHLALDDAVDAHLDALGQFTLVAVHAILNPRSAEYYRRTREARLKTTLEEALPTGERREKTWKSVEDAFGHIAKWFPADSPFISGNSASPMLADLRIAAELMWVKTACGEDSDEWESIASWHGGRWSNLIRSLEKYE